MEREVLFYGNKKDKLCRQLVSLVDFSKGNNYQDTHIRVEVRANFIIVSTLCCGEDGDIWYNDNETYVWKSDIPLFTLKKLGML